MGILESDFAVAARIAHVELGLDKKVISITA